MFVICGGPAVEILEEAFVIHHVVRSTTVNDKFSRRGDGDGAVAGGNEVVVEGCDRLDALDDVGQCVLFGSREV